jgi:hypothetical protein
MPHPQQPHEKHPQPALDAASGPQPEGAWPQTAWGWACWVALLLGGQAVLLVICTWTLAAAISHGWLLPLLLALGLLARLVPDALRLAEWACAARSWTPPIAPGLHYGIALTTLLVATLCAIAG